MFNGGLPRAEGKVHHAELQRDASGCQTLQTNAHPSRGGSENDLYCSRQPGSGALPPPESELKGHKREKKKKVLHTEIQEMSFHTRQTLEAAECEAEYSQGM